MSGEINVVNRTQTIKVDPASGGVAIINAGPAGPGGPPGAQGAGPLGPFLQGVIHGPFTSAQGNFVPIPGGGITKSFALTKTGPIQVIMSAYVDTGLALPNEIAFGVNLRGANTSQPPSIPEQVLRCGGRTSVSSTFSMSYIHPALVVGTTYADLFYRAQAAGATISDVCLTIVVIPS